MPAAILPIGVISGRIKYMGFVTQFFIKPAKPALVQQPSGSFMVDRQGKITTSTLPGSFSSAHAKVIGEHVLSAFRSADRAEIKVSELVIHFLDLKLIARSMRGGAMVFVLPRSAMADSAGGGKAITASA
jgi:hypothetical protein